MKVIITGGAGFIGRKLAKQLSADAASRGIEKIVLFDQVAPPADDLADPLLEAVTGDITDALVVAGLIDARTSHIFHLAAVVSAGAEADFDLGYRVNLGGTQNVLEAARALGTCPRVMFASSIAAYGGELPDLVVDETPLLPATSYGVQKVIGEQLINDYTRKGYVDGRAMRLPTVVVRPGKPNLAASGFASGIIREPLNGIDFVCPVTEGSRMAMISPRRVVDAFIHLSDLPGESLGSNRTILLPGFTVSMAQAVSALEEAAGNRHRGAIRFQVDPVVQAIVDGWPVGSYSARAEGLGFKGDDDMVAIIAAYIEDELQEAAS